MSDEAKLVKNQLEFLISGTTGAVYHNKGIKYGTKDVFSFDENGVLTINEDVQQSTTFIRSETTYINDHIFSIGSSTGATAAGSDSMPYGISVGGVTGDTGNPAAEFLYYPVSKRWEISDGDGKDAKLTGLTAGTSLNDAVNFSQLSDEKSTRTSEVISLDTRLENEESNRTSEVISLDTRLENEESNRTSEVSSLDTRLEIEESNRLSYISSLETQLYSEVATLVDQTNIDPTYIAVGDGSTGLTGFSNFTWNDYGSTGMLGVTGDVNVYGDVTAHSFSASSDRKLKTNIEEIVNSELIHSLRSVKYNWIDQNQDQRTKYGFIAQEVQEILPDIVNHGVSHLSIDYIQLISHLVKEVQKLRVDVDELQKK
jgi:hypothetical protein